LGSPHRRTVQPSCCLAHRHGAAPSTAIARSPPPLSVGSLVYRRPGPPQDAAAKRRRGDQGPPAKPSADPPRWAMARSAPLRLTAFHGPAALLLLLNAKMIKNGSRTKPDGLRNPSKDEQLNRTPPLAAGRCRISPAPRIRRWLLDGPWANIF
jgi:hypothetical protein